MRQKLKIALQMDPLEKLDLKGDSTFILGLEAIKRGFELYFYSPSDLIYKNNNVYAKAKILDLAFENKKETFNYGKIKVLKLSSLDVILMRQDPPFNMSYITATHILEKIASQTLILNNPFHVRNAPEKIFVTEFSKFMPETLITRETSEIIKFKKKNKNIIIKPLYGNGGAGIFRLKEDDKNLTSLHELFSSVSSEPLIAQAFLPDVKNGDKRIILVDGDPVGAINRVPKVGETRSNMHVGGKAERAKLSQRDKEICSAIGPLLKSRGQIFVGIDVIGDYLTEINVTSPTGIQELERFDKVNIAEMIWHAVEKKLNSFVS